MKEIKGIMEEKLDLNYKKIKTLIQTKQYGKALSVITENIAIYKELYEPLRKYV